MSRLLLDRSTNQLLPYPRQDNEPVAGLDRDAAYVVEVVRDSEPEYDASTHCLQALEPVIAITDPGGDDVNGSATYGWELVAIPEPAPMPDWGTFKGGLLTSAAVAQVMGAAREAGAEPAVTNLPVALQKAEGGNPAEFAACWSMVIAAGGASPEALAALSAAAEACNLPADFVAALAPIS
jgi:hypothetical protein